LRLGRMPSNLGTSRATVETNESVSTRASAESIEQCHRVVVTRVVAGWTALA
jgi:predicted transcriptional regulator